MIHTVDRIEYDDREQALRIFTLQGDAVLAQPGLGELLSVDGNHVVELLVRVSARES